MLKKKFHQRKPFFPFASLLLLLFLLFNYCSNGHAAGATTATAGLVPETCNADDQECLMMVLLDSINKQGFMTADDRAKIYELTSTYSSYNGRLSAIEAEQEATRIEISAIKAEQVALRIKQDVNFKRLKWLAAGLFAMFLGGVILVLYIMRHVESINEMNALIARLKNMETLVEQLDLVKEDNGQEAEEEASPELETFLCKGAVHEYTCPISRSFFRDPVLCLADGFSYERSAIESWVAQCTRNGQDFTSPMLGRVGRFGGNLAVPNKTLRKLVKDFRDAKVAEFEARMQRIQRVQKLLNERLGDLGEMAMRMGQAEMEKLVDECIEETMRGGENE